MYSKFSSFSLMGMSNSELFLSEKLDHNPMECNLLSRPPRLDFQETCQMSPLESAQEKEHEQEKEDTYKVLCSSLEIKLPSSSRSLPLSSSFEDFKVEEDNDDGCTTPKSLEHKIPLICPPAPRKPKTIQSKKRKASSRRRILLDFSREIESMFPVDLLADLGKKIKKVRTEN